jgi:hypothetical protein
MEDRTQRRHLAIVMAVEYELEEAVDRQGGVLVGFSVKYGGSDCLLVLRVVFEGELKVAFMGGEDLGSALIKAVREVQGGKARWRDDKYVGQS